MIFATVPELVRSIVAGVQRSAPLGGVLPDGPSSKRRRVQARRISGVTSSVRQRDLWCKSYPPGSLSARVEGPSWKRRRRTPKSGGGRRHYAWSYRPVWVVLRNINWAARPTRPGPSPHEGSAPASSMPTRLVIGPCTSQTTTGQARRATSAPRPRPQLPPRRRGRRQGPLTGRRRDPGGNNRRVMADEDAEDPCRRHAIRHGRHRQRQIDRRGHKVPLDEIVTGCGRS